MGSVIEAIRPTAIPGVRLDVDPDTLRRKAEIEAWKKLVARFQEPSRWRAVWQLVNTFGTYAALWVAMYWSSKWSWWCTIPLAILSAGVLVRVFILFHDCGHGSFFASRRANDFWGFIGGLLAFTPYYHWRWEHALHHATAGDLDRRGVGDLWTLTVQEYLASSRWRKFSYRIARNPIVLFVLAPALMIAVWQRFPSKDATRTERSSVWWMNLAIAGMVFGMSSIFGFVPYLVIQGIIMIVAGSAGVWLFYVQHQFEDAYWERGEDWDYTDAALKGSSFYQLPKILQWFSANIGFHHIHHLSPRIPNYNLERCHRSDPMFHGVPPVKLLPSMKLLTLRVWDESARKLIGYRRLRGIREERGRESKDGKSAVASRAGEDSSN
jgi:omega-6 fatty acid desaturase (delta-12 desaturase)